MPCSSTPPTAWAKTWSGLGESRRILRLQAHAEQRLPADLQKTLGSKEFKLVYDVGGGRRCVKNVPVPPADRARFAISDDEILTLARWACLIEDHYTRQARPADADGHRVGQGWAHGRAVIVQARPETVQSRKATRRRSRSYQLRASGRVLVTGRSVGEKIAAAGAGDQESRRSGAVSGGEVLVTDKTDPDWEPMMKKAAAIVTNRGGRTCHAAIVSRELGVARHRRHGDRHRRAQDGQMVTVSCAEGETGFVYEGRLQFEVQRIDLDRPRRARRPRS